MFRSKPSAEPIKVALIDDHFLILESVQHQLAGNQEFELVATGTAGEELEPIIEQHHPKGLHRVGGAPGVNHLRNSAQPDIYDWQI